MKTFTTSTLLRNSILLALINILILCTTETRAQWKQSNGPGGAYICCSATRGADIFVGTQWGGIFRSSDSGNSWKAVNNGLTAQTITSIDIQGDTIFAVSYGSGIFMSTDKGESWITRNTGLPTDTYGYVWAYTIAINGSDIYLGTVGHGVFHSSNGGESWSAANIGIENEYIDVIAFTNSNIFVSGYSSGELYSSSNKGQLWSIVDKGEKDFSVRSMVTKGDTIIAGTTSCSGMGGVCMSPDNGTTWIDIERKALGSAAKLVAMNGDTILASILGKGIFCSPDYGNTWSMINGDIRSTFINTLTIVDNIIFAGTVDAGVISSTNNGINWKEMNNGLAATRVNALAIKDNRVYAGVSENSIEGVYSSFDQGATWSAITNGIRQGLSLAVKGDTLFVGSTQGIFRSIDNGVNWTSINTGLTNLDFDLAVNVIVINEDKIFIGTRGGIFLSTDNGDHWTRKNKGLGDILKNKIITSLLVKESYLFAGTEGGIFVSTDNAENWTQMNTGLDMCGENCDVKVNSLVSIGENIFAVWHTKVYLSTNYGANWKIVNHGMESMTSETLTKYGINLLAGTWNGTVFLSGDNGTSWRNIGEGLSNNPILVLAVNDEAVYAGTYGDGVWTRPLSEIVLNDYNPVDSIEIYTENGSNKISISKGWKQLLTHIYPSDATFKTVNWVISSDYEELASISSDGLLSATKNGSLYAKAISSDNPEIVDSFLIEITNQVSVNNIVDDQRIHIGFNPVVKSYQINANKDIYNAKLIICSLSGSVVYSESIQSIPFVLPNQKPGVYIVNIFNKEQRVIQKIVY